MGTGAAVLAIYLSACSTLAVFPDEFARGRAQTPPLDVPMQAQESQDYCGIAAIGMVSAYYKKPVAAARYDLLRAAVAANSGTTGTDMKAAFESAGYFAVIFKGALDGSTAGLMHHLDAHRPLIVMVGDRASRHYLVVTGYDAAQAVVFVNDPAGYKLAIRYGFFLKEWEAADRFTLLATP